MTWIVGFEGAPLARSCGLARPLFLRADNRYQLATCEVMLPDAEADDLGRVGALTTFHGHVSVRARAKWRGCPGLSTLAVGHEDGVVLWAETGLIAPSCLGAALEMPAGSSGFQRVFPSSMRYRAEYLDRAVAGALLARWTEELLDAGMRDLRRGCYVRVLYAAGRALCVASPGDTLRQEAHALKIAARTACHSATFGAVEDVVRELGAAGAESVQLRAAALLREVRP